MSTAVKCPVCEGRGSVPHNFYTGGEQNNTGTVMCNTCRGSGMVILESNPVVIPAYVPPYYHYPSYDPWNPRRNVTD